MKQKFNFIKQAIVLGVVSSLLIGGPALAKKKSQKKVSVKTASTQTFFTMKDGKLQRPVGYREWIYVGTPLTPDDMNNGKANFREFHTVYVDPVSWAQWKKTGEFPEGTITIKEMTSVGSKTATSGNGYFMGEFAGLEASIKSKKYFPDAPGNWAYFSFTTEDHKTLKKENAPEATAACAACHTAAAADDMVFTQYYPVLRNGKGKDEAKAAGGLDDNLIPAPYPDLK